jgi:hypothetical protein
MRRKARASADSGARFDVSTQSGGSINNVGGNLYYGGVHRRSAAAGRAAAALGLTLVFVALAFFAVAGVNVYEQATSGKDAGDLTIPGYLPAAVGLLVAGIVLNRFGRLFAGH